MMRIVRAAAAGFVLSASAAAHAQPTPAPEPQWREMAPGSHFAPAYGDWEKGAHGKLIRLAPGLDVPFHSHSNDYHGVMVSGRMTNVYQDGKSSIVGSGDYWDMPAKVPHAHKCVSEEPCLLYTHMGGTWDYIPHEPE